MDKVQSIHHSYWVQHGQSAAGALQQTHPTLEQSIETDVAIVGAGITGLSTALELLQRGYRVAVLEAAVIGAGTTGGSTGHLDVMPETGLTQLLQSLGEDKSQQYVRLRQDAIAAIRSRSDQKSQFREIPGYMYSERTGEPSDLRANFEAARQLGLPVQWQHELPLPHAVYGFRIDGMGRIDSLAYLQRLAELVIQAGGRIYERTMVHSPLDPSAGPLAAGGGSVQCKHSVCAVHCNSTQAMRVYLQTPPYQSYVIAARVVNVPPDALYWDDATPYFYTRIASQADPDVVVVGGRDHRTGEGDPAESLRELEAYIRERYEVRNVISRWSAELFEPTDGLPLIGRVTKNSDEESGNVWLATGLSGIGLTWGTAAGWLLADQISGRQVPLQADLSPLRFGVSKLSKLAAEQIPAAASYSKRVLPAESIDPMEIRIGEGKVGNLNGDHAGVCRDKAGCLHAVRPICSHMGGVLSWNAAQQTWDCPVHGGRFSADGKRIYGPPEADLETRPT